MEFALITAARFTPCIQARRNNSPHSLTDHLSQFSLLQSQILNMVADVSRCPTSYIEPLPESEWSSSLLTIPIVEEDGEIRHRTAQHVCPDVPNSP